MPLVDAAVVVVGIWNPKPSADSNLMRPVGARRCFASPQRRLTSLSDETTSTELVESSLGNHHSMSRTIPSSARHRGPVKSTTLRSSSTRAWTPDRSLRLPSSTSTRTRVGSGRVAAHRRTLSRKAAPGNRPMAARTLSWSMRTRLNPTMVVLAVSAGANGDGLVFTATWSSGALTSSSTRPVVDTSMCVAFTIG